MESPKLARHAMREITHELVEWDYGQAPAAVDTGAVEDDDQQSEDSGFRRRSTVH